METYELKGEEYIELIKLLKIMRISESGGQAKLRAGDLIEVFDFQIRIE